MLDCLRPQATLGLVPRETRVRILDKPDWTLPPDAVRCDSLTEFGNPFAWFGSIGATGSNWWVERGRKRWTCKGRRDAQQTAANLHADWLAQPEQMRLRNRVRDAFQDKRPACVCKLDAICHGDTLAAVAITPLEAIVEAVP